MDAALSFLRPKMRDLKLSFVGADAFGWAFVGWPVGGGMLAALAISPDEEADCVGAGLLLGLEELALLFDRGRAAVSGSRCPKLATDLELEMDLGCETTDAAEEGTGS